MGDIAIDYDSIRQEKILGRYVNHSKINEILKFLPKQFHIQKIGTSVKGVPLESITFGSGSKRILMWSQMHGNESTTTKAVFDLLNFVQSQNELAIAILNNCTICLIPMLNPDGAKAYTRVNANSVDINRDAIDLSQPESVALKECFEDFKPDYCFNLHDQRTIFNTGLDRVPATVSFLAPAHDVERSISKARSISMQLIVAMYEKMQVYIPGQVGRYDDSFNPNCVGDAFQMQEVPTILFESGHFPGDYQREKTRELIFISLCKALKTISKELIDDFKYEAYFDIPENGKLYYDVLIKNAHVLDPEKFNVGDKLGVLFKETLFDDKIAFKPFIEKVGDLKGYFGHVELDSEDSNDLVAVKAMGLIAEFN